MHVRTTMIIPSRGRPAAAEQAALSAIENAVLPHTCVIIAVDGCCDTEEEHQSRAMHTAYASIARPRIGVMLGKDHRGMIATLNQRAAGHLGLDSLYIDHWKNGCDCQPYGCYQVTHVGFMGDDHRVRTPGWDEMLTRAAGPLGIAYGDDLIQGEQLPTAVLMAADIVRIVGHMCPPVLEHLFIDNYWKALGEGIDAIEYVPDVVIEHLHPSAGKAEMDESYARTNHPDQYERDGQAWRDYCDGGHLQNEVDAVRRQAEVLRWMGVAWLPGAVGPDE